MQRIFLKSISQEIVIRGNPKEGHTDVFAYNYYNDNDKRKLGGLFIVGNVKQDATTAEDENTPSIAYITNLVASLAKREYYSRLEISPREAFSATLKKINGVIEEFFKNKALKMNIGIFAIAGEQMLISKIGKFKIILGRPARLSSQTGASEEPRIVDVLNNIDLFNKEQVEEREFSNIVSGKIMPGDKLFAFYPSRLVLAREKFIKANLLKFDDEQFAEKINSIKEIKPDFDCGALYLSLNNHKESTVVKRAKPIIPEKSETTVKLANARSNNPPLISKEGKDDPLIDVEPERRSRRQGIEVPVPTLTSEQNINIETSEEVPRIISSEFSLGKKKSPFLAPLKIIRGLYADSGSYIGNLSGHKLSQNTNFKRKFVVLSLTAGFLIIGIVVAKKFIVINPEQRQLNAVINQTQNNLKLAKTKISQKDFIGARQLLANSLSGIYGVSVTNDKIQKTTSDVYEVLDNIDKAVEVSPSLLEVMPEELGQKITVIATQKEKLGTNEYNITSPVAFDIYENNLYVLTQDNIFKIVDFNQSGKKESLPWLKPSGTLSQSSMIAVDSNVYVMNNSGTLATFYKGEKVSETNTFIVSNSNDALLTSKDSDKLYVINKSLSRVYELDKKSKSLIRTLKIGSSEPFVDAYLHGNSTIIITTKDGRIWEIK